MPALMPNLRGLIFLFFGREVPIWLLAIAAFSGLWWAARCWTELETGFATSIAVIIATSYHAYLPDLVLLLIPLLVLAKLPARWSVASMIVFCTIAVPVIPYACQTSGDLAVLVLPIVLLSILVGTSQGRVELEEALKPHLLTGQRGR